MKTQQELATFLDGIFPTAYYDWSGSSEIPKAPYLVYLLDKGNSFGADDKAYNRTDTYTVELYVDRYDYNSEKELETSFDETNLFYEKAGKTFVSELQLFLVIYKITI